MPWGDEKPGRSITAADRRKLRAELARAKSPPQLRDRALFLTLWSSAMRVSEALALDLAQCLEDPDRPTLGRFRAEVLLRPEQTKGRRNVPPPQRWNSAGRVHVSAEARAALRPYVQLVLARGWTSTAGPLFISMQGRGHGRLSKRAAQRAWHELQTRAQIRDHYRLHDLRHDAVTRFAAEASGDVFAVAAFARFNDIRTAQRYVHMQAEEIARLAERASRR